MTGGEATAAADKQRPDCPAWCSGEHYPSGDAKGHMSAAKQVGTVSIWLYAHPGLTGPRVVVQRSHLSSRPTSLNLGLQEAISWAKVLEGAGPGNFELAGRLRDIVELTQDPAVCGQCLQAPVSEPGKDGIFGRFCTGCVGRCGDYETPGHRCAICR